MERKILVEVSARHVHVTQADLEILFGKDHPLTIKKMLSQPGQYASEEKVTVAGPKKELAGVSILGPVRKATQIELSMTDCRTVGAAAPIKESGDIAGSAPCKIIGPVGEISVPEGLIVAKRHVHLTPATAAAWGLKDKDLVSVRIETPERALTFSDVVVRVRADFADAMHIDTDEGNAANLSGVVYGTIL